MLVHDHHFILDQDIFYLTRLLRAATELVHRNIQNMVRYTELSLDRFRSARMGVGRSSRTCGSDKSRAAAAGFDHGVDEKGGLIPPVIMGSPVILVLQE